MNAKNHYTINFLRLKIRFRNYANYKNMTRSKKTRRVYNVHIDCGHYFVEFLYQNKWFFYLVINETFIGKGLNESNIMRL